MFSIFKRKKISEVLALDIGTEVVKAFICKISEEEQKGIVLGVGKIGQRLGNMQSGAVSDISGVIESSRRAIEEAKKESKIAKIKHTVVGIAGELIKGTTTTVHYERVNSQVKISLAELRDIIQQVQLKAYERIRQQIAWESGQADIDIKLINASIVNVSIDGYQVSNPLNFQGKDVSISVFNAYAPMMHLGALQTIADELGVGSVSIVAEPYAVARSVDYEGEFDFNAIFVDIGGGTTDIAVVRNGGLEGTRIFALGGRAFTKKIAYELNISFTEAEKLKIEYSANKLDKNISEKIKNVLKDDCQVWLGGLEIALAEFSENDLLPLKILLCGGGAALPEIKEALASPGWTKTLPFAKAPQISFLQPRDVRRMIDKTGKLTSPQDVTPMGLANLMIEMAGEEKMISGILRRAMEEVQE